MDYLTSEEFLQVCRYIDGKDDGELFGSDILTRFRRMCYAFEDRVHKDGLEQARRASSLQRRLDRLAQKEAEAVALGDIPCAGFGSDEIMRAVMHLMKSSGIQAGETRAMQITYLAYATWLHSRRERLCMDHPQAMPSGPHFWIASEWCKEHRDFTATQFRNAWETLAKGNPGVADMLRNAVAKYGRYSETLMKDILCRSKPYLLAHKDNNNGKWNKILEDGNIYEWKSQNK